MSWYNNPNRDANIYNFPDMEVVKPDENAVGINFSNRDPNNLIGHAKIYQRMIQDFFKAQEEEDYEKARMIDSLIQDFLDEHGETLVVKDGPLGMPLTFYDDGSVG